MIELIIKGACKICPYRVLFLNEYDDTVSCRHEMVCKFIGDPKGKDWLRTVMKMMEERNADA